MDISVLENDGQVAHSAAQLIATQVRRKPNSVLGLASGATSLGIYRELVLMHQELGLDFTRVTTFNLDEYLGIGPEHPQSYFHFMREHLFAHVDIPEANQSFPATDRPDPGEACQEYEERIAASGGMDLLLLGIGSHGHIAFNEPGSSFESRTHVQELAPQTRKDNARFFEDPSGVPHFAITMGIGTILEAKQILLVATGPGKSRAVAQALNGPVEVQCPASVLQTHPQVVVLLDALAAGDALRREACE